jgi:O-antigen ligase
VPSRTRSAVAPLYLFACLILGGSAQGVWQNMVLQLAGLLIIGWAAVAPPDESLPSAAKPLLLLAIAAVVVVALQAVPVPADLGGHGIRARIADGYRLLGRPVPALPVSVSPYASVAALLCLIPPLAMFCAIVRLKAYRPAWLGVALLAGTLAGIVLAVLQVAGGPRSPWYLYAETNAGLGVGFFANANHMADLLVISLAFVAATAGTARSRSVQHYRGILIVALALVVVVIAGIALTDSVAGYALSLPVLIAGALIVLPPASRWRGVLLAVAALSVLASVAALTTTSIGATRIGQEAATSAQSREEILRITSKAIADFMPFGSGLGSFVKVYPLYESPDSVTTEYVIHAHNDYAELALELGVPGVILVLLFLAWWIAAVWAVWLRGQGGPFVRAASIASAAVLIHSLVDFPLRTAAISTCFAMCLALLADRRAPRRQEASDLRPARHLVVG